MSTPAELDLRPSSCACEMTWLAAYIPLLAEWLRAMEDDDIDRAMAACHKLKRQVGRMLVHYERGPSVIRVPLLALEAAIASMEEAMRFKVDNSGRRGAKFNLVELQRTLQQSLRAFQRITFEALDRDVRDALLYPEDDSGEKVRVLLLAISVGGGGGVGPDSDSSLDSSSSDSDSEDDSDDSNSSGGGRGRGGRGRGRGRW